MVAQTFVQSFPVLCLLTPEFTVLAGVAGGWWKEEFRTFFYRMSSLEHLNVSEDRGTLYRSTGVLKGGIKLLRVLYRSHPMLSCRGEVAEPEASLKTWSALVGVRHLRAHRRRAAGARVLASGIAPN